MAVSTRVTVTVEMRETAVDGSSVGSDRFSFTKTYQFLDAAGALGCTKFFADNRVLDSTNENLDLNGSLASKLGTAVALTKGRILLNHWGGASGTAKFDYGVANGATGLIDGAVTLGADGMLLLIDPTAAGRVITPTSADLCTVTTTASGAYDFAVGGE